jgi:hypothetical protein
MVRVSLGYKNTKDEVDELISIINLELNNVTDINTDYTIDREKDKLVPVERTTP